MSEMIYEGKTKQIYSTPKANEMLVYFKDDATAFNGEKKGQIQDKGILNNKITNFLFEMLEKEEISTHLIKPVSERETLVKKLKIVPLQVMMRNVSASSLSKRLGIEEGIELPEPVREFYYKNDDLGNPLVNDDHIQLLFGEEIFDVLDGMDAMAVEINQILTKFFQQRGIILVDVKLEFGIDSEGYLTLGDEISPDTCRFWDATTREKLDKDRFRRDLGYIEEAYQEVWKRISSS